MFLDPVVEGVGYVPVNHRIKKYTAEGEWKQNWGDADADTVSDESKRTYGYGCNPMPPITYGPGSLDTDRFNRPFGISLSPNDEFLYVADMDNHRIQKLSVTELCVPE